MKKITDRTFVYVSAAATDIRKTIARERKRLAKLGELKRKFNTVVQIKREAK